MRISAGLVAASFLLASPVAAEVVAIQKVEKERVEKNVAGEPVIKRVEAQTVSPGEEVIYSLHFENRSDKAAEALVLVMPVPDVISYVEGSVVGARAQIAFSADGGQTYVGRGRLTVIEDGSARPAKSDEITHIKWVLEDAVPPQGNGEIAFRGILR